MPCKEWRGETYRLWRESCVQEGQGVNDEPRVDPGRLLERAKDMRESSQLLEVLRRSAVMTL